jgi:hypothetical protein
MISEHQMLRYGLDSGTLVSQQVILASFESLPVDNTLVVTDIAVRRLVRSDCRHMSS